MKKIQEVIFSLVNIRNEKIEAIPAFEKSGYIYLINDGSKTKIGQTTNPNYRIPALLTIAGIDSPYVFVSNRLKHHIEIEKMMLAEFRHKKIIGEWVRALPDEIAEKTKVISMKCTKYACSSIENLTIEQGVSK